jgi:simple sugar transport system permease protein
VQLVRRAVVPSLALLTALIVGAVLIVLTDFEHLQRLGSDPVGALRGALGQAIDGYGAMLSGAIGDPARILAAVQGGNPTDIAGAIRPLTETLLIATPFIFVSLALAISFHAGLFNLGAAGQFAIGGLGAALVASTLAGLPPVVVLAAGLAAGALFGGAYGFVPGLLKARRGAHEVITTLMLNFIAPNIVLLVANSGVLGRAARLTASVPLIFDLPTIRLDYGFVAALLTAAAVSVLLFRTTLGFELRAAGFSRSAARSAGIRPGGTLMVAMALSGGLTGLGSAFFLLGPANGIGGGPSFDFGYAALALALLGGLRPSGIVLVALLYGALNTGAKSMVVATGVPLALLGAIIGFALLFVAAPGLVRSIWHIRPPRGEFGDATIVREAAHGI